VRPRYLVPSVLIEPAFLLAEPGRVLIVAAIIVVAAALAQSGEFSFIMSGVLKVSQPCVVLSTMGVSCSTSRASSVMPSPMRCQSQTVDSVTPAPSAISA
jgi:hypothetical protein